MYEFCCFSHACQCFVYCVLCVLSPNDLSAVCAFDTHGAPKMCTAEVWTDRSVPRMLFHAIDIYVELGSCCALPVNLLIFSFVCVCVHWIFSAEAAKKEEITQNNIEDWIYKWHHFKLAMAVRIEDKIVKHTFDFSTLHVAFPYAMDSVSNFSITFSSHSSFLSDVM